MKFYCDKHGLYEPNTELISPTELLHVYNAACPLCGETYYSRYQPQQFNGRRLRLVRKDTPDSVTYRDFDKCAVFGAMMTVSCKDSLDIYRADDFSEISVVGSDGYIFTVFQSDKEPDSFITRITKMFAKK